MVPSSSSRVFKDSFDEESSLVEKSLGENRSTKTASTDHTIFRAVLVGVVVIATSLSVYSLKQGYNLGGFPGGSNLASSGSNAKGSKAVKPNFVFIVADDLGWNSIGYQNFDLAFATPILTNLASNGIILDNYYAQEVCTPSRASLLTGRYPLSVGMQYGVVDVRTPWGLDLSEQTIAEVLSEEGYATSIIGKWHLGHHSPRFLPTARGFDSFVGYLNGDNYYFSKRNPLEKTFVDFMQSDRNCYSPYTAEDYHNYSTHFYRNKAVDVIEGHDQSVPLFLYLPFQAVHDPFDDIVTDKISAGDFLPPDVRERIDSEIVGARRLQYAYALALLDGAVGGIVNALERTGMMDNTYLIFASDNGGCFAAGGKNGPLRGTKGTLFEGGVKVDAFVYSPLLTEEVRGTKFDKLMHVSDWFPTMLDMADIDFSARSGYELDGVSQLDAWSTGDAARTEVLYNSAHNVKGKDFSIDKNQPFAVRNEQYKLIHYWNSSSYVKWYDPSTVLADDDGPNWSECSATSSYAFDGEYLYALFDLVKDPYETTNLFDAGTDEVEEAKTALYSLLDTFHSKSRMDIWKSVKASKSAPIVWQAAGGYIVPYVKVDDEEIDASEVYSSSYPTLCLA